jgi:hypothetical protein
MAIEYNPQKGDIGTEFVITIKDKGIVVPIASATKKEFKFVDPSGNVTVKEAAFVSDGNDGKLTYTTIEGDLYAAGEWKIQAYVEMISWTGNTKIGTFTVEDNYEPEPDPEPGD